MFSVMTIALTLFYKGPVLKYYGVTPPDTIESLSIPAQHIARVIADDGTLSEKQEKLLSKAVDVSQIKKNMIRHFRIQSRHWFVRQETRNILQNIR